MRHPQSSVFGGASSSIFIPPILQQLGRATSHSERGRSSVRVRSWLWLGDTAVARYRRIRLPPLRFPLPRATGVPAFPSTVALDRLVPRRACACRLHWWAWAAPVPVGLVVLAQARAQVATERVVVLVQRERVALGVHAMPCDTRSR